MRKIIKNRKGLTLVEIIVSIALIGIIVVAFMPLFVMSAKNNNKSEIALDSTYLGKDAMELAYELSLNINYDNLEEELNNRGYTFNETDHIFVYEYDDKKYLNMKFSEEGNLVRVQVKIYKDKNMEDLEAQYESLYSWHGKGD